MTDHTGKVSALSRNVAILAALFLLPAAANATQFQDPSRYFSYQTKTSEDQAWAPIDKYYVCSAQSRSGATATPIAVRVVALSGENREIKCGQSDGPGVNARMEAAVEDLRNAEVAAATAARSTLDEGIPDFSANAMLMLLLKHEPDSLSEQAWLVATRDEIRHAQYRDKHGPLRSSDAPVDWVFPPESVREWNVQIAAEELLPNFKSEALRRAQDIEETFVMRTWLGNLKYDFASGMMLFGNGTTADKPITLKRPLNAKHQGIPVYYLNASDGLVKHTDAAPLTVYGFRDMITAGFTPRVVTDRELVAHGIKMPQDRVEKLMNEGKVLAANVVMTITGAQGRPGMNASSGILFARVDKVFITDPTGRVLATYDADALPRWPSAQAAHRTSATR
jgi:hypothetical protein